MTKLTFKKRQLEIDLFGEEIKIDFPTWGKLKKYQQPKEGESDIELGFRLLSDLGISEGLLDKMEPSHITQILDALMSTEKN